MLFIYFGLFILFVNGRLKFIISKPTLFLGKISFALYLVHQYISMRLIIPYATDRLHMNFRIVALFIALPVVIAVATFITYFIEIPVSKKMRGTLNKFFFKFYPLVTVSDSFK